MTGMPSRTSRSTRSFLSLIAAGVLGVGALAGCVGPLGSVHATDTVDLSLDVAAGTPVRVETFNGDVDVSTAAGANVSALVTRTGEGDTKAEAEADRDKIEVTLQMVDGSAVLRAVYAPSPNKINGGRGAGVSIRVPEGTAVDLGTSNGDVSVRDTKAAVTVDTSNGAVDLRGVNGVLTVETSNQTITVEADQANADLHTSNGAVTFQGSLAPGSHRLVTSNGAVELRLPAESCFTIDATTSNNEITSDFDVQGTTSRDSLRGVAGVAGSGEPVAIEARTSNGPIAIHRT